MISTHSFESEYMVELKHTWMHKIKYNGGWFTKQLQKFEDRPQYQPFQIDISLEDTYFGMVKKVIVYTSDKVWYRKLISL